MSPQDDDHRSLPLGRREVLAVIAATGASLALGPSDAVAAAPLRSIPMITCIIRYQIDPFQLEAFAEYARNWGRIIPECGGHLVGYFLPYEGTNDVAWGLIAFENLTAYEAYRARLRSHPGARQNFATAQAKRLILREERNFVQIVEGTLGKVPGK